MELWSTLSHEDSNLDRQNQNLLYYLYTMGQRIAKVRLRIKISKQDSYTFFSCCSLKKFLLQISLITSLHLLQNKLRLNLLLLF